MYRQTPTAILITLALGTMPLAARPTDEPAGFGRGWRSEERQELRLQKLTDFLDLSDAQTLEIEALLAEHRQARRQLLTDMRSTQEELRTELEAETPDASRVGTAAIELHRQRQAMRNQGELHVATIRSALTPEQAERFDTMLEVREMGRQQADHDRRGHRGPRGRRGGPHVPGR